MSAMIRLNWSASLLDKPVSTVAGAAATEVAMAKAKAAEVVVNFIIKVL